MVLIAAPEAPNRLREISRQALRRALGEVGNGEEGGNNLGRHVVKYRRARGGIFCNGSWCAAFVSWCFEEAAAELGHYLPFKRSEGAKRLASRIARVGRWLSDDENPEPGDVVVWDRGRLLENGETSWKGHIGIVALHDPNTDRMDVVEGNRGPFPARVNLFKYYSGRWRQRLVGVARLT